MPHNAVSVALSAIALEARPWRHDCELRALQPAGVQIVEVEVDFLRSAAAKACPTAPGGGAIGTNVSNPYQDFLAVATHADGSHTELLVAALSGRLRITVPSKIARTL